jgi:hypothetical protein
MEPGHLHADGLVGFGVWISSADELPGAARFGQAATWYSLVRPPMMGLRRSR